MVLNISSEGRRYTFGGWATVALALILALMFVALPLHASPPMGKGGGKGKKGGGGSGPIPEQHFQWRVQLNGSYSAVRPAVGPDGTIYAVDVRDHLFAVNADGTVRWVRANAGSKGVDVGRDGTIYTGNEDWIKAYRPDGSLKWTYALSPRAFVLTDVAVGPDGHVYAVASSGLGVFSLADTPSGPQLRWTTPEGYGRPFVGYTEIAFGPTADGMDQQLYFYANGHTRAVQLSDGTSIFTVGGGNTPPKVSPTRGTWHRPTTAYTPEAQIDWSFEFPLATATSEPSLGHDGTHYVVNSATTVYAIDSFGIEKWRAGMGENVVLPDVDPAGTVLLLETQRTTRYPAALKAVSARNGSPLWRMEFPPDDTGMDQFVDSGAAFSADARFAYVTTAVAGGRRSYLNAVLLDPSIPSASTMLRSTGVTIESRLRRRSVNFTGTVAIHDQNRAPVSGATVHATWTLPDGTQEVQTASTGGSGDARFSASGPRGLYRLTVDDVSREGYLFDPQHSVLEGIGIR